MIHTDYEASPASPLTHSPRLPYGPAPATMKLVARVVMIRIFALALFVLSSACGAGSGALVANRSPGERLYRARCAGCHRLYEPGQYDANGWHHQLDTMGTRAHLGAVERAAIEEWLRAEARPIARKTARAE